jgi:hypothetical protein
MRGCSVQGQPSAELWLPWTPLHRSPPFGSLNALHYEITSKLHILILVAVHSAVPTATMGNDFTTSHGN